MDTRHPAWTVRWTLHPGLRAIGVAVMIGAAFAVSVLGWAWSGAGTQRLAVAERVVLVAVVAAAGAAALALLRPAAILSADGRLLVRGPLRTRLVRLSSVVHAQPSRRGLELTLADGTHRRVSALRGRAVDEAAAYSPRLAWAMGLDVRPRLAAVPAMTESAPHAADVARTQRRAAHREEPAPESFIA